jgi:hypothetical protein
MVEITIVIETEENMGEKFTQPATVMKSFKISSLKQTHIMYM